MAPLKKTSTLTGQETHICSIFGYKVSIAPLTAGNSQINRRNNIRYQWRI